MSQLFSLAEVAEYNGEDGKATWIIIRDIVYDVTSYLDDHPGGGELITEWAGKDATKGFDDFGHSNDAKKLLRPFRIGELIEEDKKANRKKKPAGAAQIISNNNNNGKSITEKPKQQQQQRKKRFSWMFC